MDRNIKRRTLQTFFGFCFFLSQTIFGQHTVEVLVVYHSVGGHTQALAEAVSAGAASVEGVRVKLLTVTETTEDDLLSADAIIVGSPVYNANVMPPVQAFINRWPFRGDPLRGKVGAAFVTAGGISAGEEIAQMNILHSMLIFGMIVVGGADWKAPFGASAVVEETPFDKKDGEEKINAYFRQKGEALGRRVAQIALRLKK